MAKMSDAINPRLPSYEPRGDYGVDEKEERLSFDRDRWLTYLRDLERRRVFGANSLEPADPIDHSC